MAIGRRGLLFAVSVVLALSTGSALALSSGGPASASVDHSAHLHALQALLGSPGAPSIIAPATAGTTSGRFLETFDGTPAAPLSYANPDGWDIFSTGLDTRENGTSAQLAHHGPGCGAPGFPYTAINSHPLNTTADQVFICNNHLMTTNGLTGYGAIYMIPPAMADMSAGTATITWDMSTLRTAARDWVYFTLMPFDGHNKLSYNNSDQAIAPNNINIKLAGTNAFVATERVDGGTDVSIGGDGFTTWDMVQEANGLTQDAARRDSFEIDLSPTHLRVCITGNNTGQSYVYKGEAGFCWVDRDLPVALDPSVWHGQAVLMITHVSYNPEKSCSDQEDQFNIVHNPIGDANCPPDTWHWDNVGINPAVPFTVLNPDQRFSAFTDPSGANTVTFSRPAPAGAHLSYVASGDCTTQRFSIDGGASWSTAVPQPATTQCQHPENGGEYWTPIPEGARSVKLTGDPVFGRWDASGISIWASGGSLPAATAQPSTAVGFRTAWVDQSAYPTLAPGATVGVTLRFRNQGTATWQRGVAGRQVNLGVVGDSTTFADLGMALGWLSPNRVATTSEVTVAPGQIGTFAFTVRAPAAPGVYRLPLRPVVDGLAWLDDQGVYVLVTSDTGFHSAWVAQSAWPVLAAGAMSGQLQVTFRNTGTQAWLRGVAGQQANLGVAGDDTSFAGVGVGWPSPNRVAIQSEASVSPGQTATFSFVVRAPATPGTYALRLRPVIDGVTWLEDEGVYVLVTVTP